MQKDAHDINHKKLKKRKLTCRELNTSLMRYVKSCNMDLTKNVCWEIVYGPRCI